ncbi:peptidoglycan DD-metalloendopeptidase family protein [Prescottella agglutinans]|uniref:Chitinase n=1 Tax=Prescottella agglutinans TaxID=1644129 RepID=A0ABT6M7Z3_9NOCA|nr:peptidoglycan DD-metalloendopeptidase family protein [Prescottella agglutinans]MDH6279549.1 putative chitinase [Prescottella agglutinans]
MAARFWPLRDGTFTLSSGFGPRWGSVHAGQDFAATDGTPFYACQGGTVLYIGAADGYGQWIVIDHSDADGSGVTEYGHMWDAYATGLKPGDRVEAGQLIGYVGSNGQSTGPHLHLSVMPYAYNPASKIDPLQWLSGAAYPGTTPPPEPRPEPGLDAQTLARAMGNTVSAERYAALLPAFTAAMREAGCTTIERAAMWCAQLGHESGGLQWMEEIADGSAYEWRQDLGNTQSGDGRRFKGRGPIQVTGRYNYGQLSAWAHGRGLIPTPTYFVDNPAELASDRYGFLGAVWYWTVARDLNALADDRDIVGATRAINGGTNGLSDRQLRYKRCLALGAALLPTGGTVTNFVEEGVAQLHPTPGLLRKINRSQNVSESTRNPDCAWPGAIWADVWNEAVWDGYDIRPEYADVPDGVGRSLVALVQTVAARQVRIEQKIDRLLEGK